MLWRTGAFVLALGAQAVGAAARMTRVRVSDVDGPLPQVPQWGVIELELAGPEDSKNFNAFEFDLTAKFSLDGDADKDASTFSVDGFYDGEGKYKIRFSPSAPGRYTYVTSMPGGLSGRGHFDCVAAEKVKDFDSFTDSPAIAQNMGFVYAADGSEHFSVGTTAYQWASMPHAMQAQTLETMKEQVKIGGFNKIRMTVFPKFYVYNHKNPIEAGAPFAVHRCLEEDDKTTACPELKKNFTRDWECEGGNCNSVAYAFNHTRFNVSFWQNYEKLVQALGDMGVVADLIVFHPYDGGHWGFDCLGGRDADTYDVTADKFYLKYLAARLGAFPNVWYAMANEWDFNGCKRGGVVPGDSKKGTETVAPTWDKLLDYLSEKNWAALGKKYSREMSIHNGAVLYDHSKPWISHVSLQGREDDTARIRNLYKKPTIWDEVRYEGDIQNGCSWGALSAREMADRYFLGFSLGVYVGHSETLLDHSIAKDDDQPLWWAKGGALKGASALKLIPWFRITMLDIFACQLPDPKNGAGCVSRQVGAGAVSPNAFKMPQPVFFANASTSAYDQAFGNVAGGVAHQLQFNDHTQGAGGMRRGYLLYFVRFGTWNWKIPSNSASKKFRVIDIDYSSMKTSTRAEYDFSGKPDGATIPFEVPTVPYSAAIIELPEKTGDIDVTSSPIVFA